MWSAVEKGRLALTLVLSRIYNHLKLQVESFLQPIPALSLRRPLNPSFTFWFSCQNHSVSTIANHVLFSDKLRWLIGIMACILFRNLRAVLVSPVSRLRWTLYSPRR